MFDMDILIFLPIYDLIYYWYVKNASISDIFGFIGLYCDFNYKIYTEAIKFRRVSLGVDGLGRTGHVHLLYPQF